MRLEPMLTARETDEVDLILIPVAQAVARLRAYLDHLGISPGQQMLVIRDRLPVAKAIAAECDHDYPSTSVH